MHLFLGSYIAGTGMNHLVWAIELISSVYDPRKNENNYPNYSLPGALGS